MQGFIATLNDSYTFAETPQGRVFVHIEACDFMLSDCEVGDCIDIEGVIDTERGLRAVGTVRWVERPRERAEEVTGAIVTIKPFRGFAFMRPDDGGAHLFLNIRDFTDYRTGGSETFMRLIPGDRVQCMRIDGHPGPRGKHISVVGGG